MPRPAITDEQRRATRRSIRDSAATLYAENGKNVSVRAVAEHAGVSVGTVYSYFGSLSELMQSLWRQPARKLVQQMTQVAKDDLNPAEELEALLGTYVRFASDNQQVFRNAFLYVRPESAEPPPKVPLAEDKFFGLFSQAIARGQQQGQFRSGDPDTLAQIVLSSVHGALALPINLHRLELSEEMNIAEQTIAVQLEWLQNPD